MKYQDKIIKEKYRAIPVILCVIDKLELICTLYIDKWGEVGLLERISSVVAIRCSNMLQINYLARVLSNYKDLNYKDLAIVQTIINNVNISRDI